MRELVEWTEADLTDLIANGVQESLSLEYKSGRLFDNARPNGAEISKDVSAMANAAGGRIIYGVREDGHLPVEVDGVDRADLSRERLEQLIVSNITPPIGGIRIHPIDLANGRVAFVVEVPQGVGAHMAHDGRYHQRHNFTTLRLNHYQVEDIMRRGTTPNVTLVPTLVQDGGVADGVQKVEVHLALVNEAATPAYYTRVQVKVSERVVQDLPGGSRWSRRRFTRGPGEPADQIYSMNLAVPQDPPSYQEDTQHLEPIRLRIPVVGLEVFRFEWVVTSPGCRNEGEIRIVSQGGGVFMPD